MTDLERYIFQIISENYINNQCKLTDRKIKQILKDDGLIYHIGSINHAIRKLCEKKKISRLVKYQGGVAGRTRTLTVL